MAGQQSTSRRPLRKPYPDFPLTPRGDGRWQKKIRGQVHYFIGSWQDALEEYKRQLPYLERGVVPPDPNAPDQLTINELVNSDRGILAHKESLVATGELTNTSFKDYVRACRRLIEYFGRDRVVSTIEPHEFAGLRAKFAVTMGPVAIGNEINRTRIIFKFAYDEALLDRPVRFGQTFRRPKQKVIRKLRSSTDRTFSPAEIYALLSAASPQLKGMILLGINAGLGNSDCGQMLKSHVQGDWLLYPRPKTGVERKARLWPETQQAITAVLSDHHEFVFTTRRGNSWHKDASENPVSAAFRKLLLQCDLYRKGETGFYSLRHTFATESRNVRDDEAVRIVMGHADQSILDEHYTRNFPESRLETIAAHMHAWLFGGGKPR